MSELNPVSERWGEWRRATDLEEYFTRWERLGNAGAQTHGEADFIASFEPASVLDAGCGMGRVAIELQRRGVTCDGVDLDDDLLAYARRAAPSVRWLHGDLASVDCGRLYDVVAMPGNVMIFCRLEDRGPIIVNLARHVEHGGVLIAGFQLERSRDALGLVEYDSLCAAAGLQLVERWSTWDRDMFVDGGDYAVSVHRHAGAGRMGASPPNIVSR